MSLIRLYNDTTQSAPTIAKSPIRLYNDSPSTTSVTNGISTITDTTGKPLATFGNDKIQASQLLPNPTPRPGVLGLVEQGVKDVVTHPIESLNKVSDYLFPKLGGEAVAHPIQTVKKIVDEVNQGADITINNLVSNAAQFRSDVLSNIHRPTSEKVATTLNLLHSIASTALFPISETYNIANHLPVIKPAADAIGVIFDTSGKVTAFAADKLLDQLPLSKQAKDALRGPINNVSSLVGQMILGGYVYEKITGLTEPNKKLDAATESSIVEDTKQKAQELQSSLQNVPQEVKPNINISEAKPVSDIVSNTQNKIRLYNDTVTNKPVDTTQIPEGQIKPIEGTGETKKRGLSQGVETKAIENKLTNSFGGLPEYQTVSLKDQAAKATELITKDPEQARRIALGRELPPNDILPESVFMAVENKAIKEGDVATLRDLATSSGLTSEATTMGQRIRTLVERDPESPVSAIKEIQTAREKAAKSRSGDLTKAKKAEAQKIKDEIKKSSPTKQTWSEFVKSIQC